MVYELFLNQAVIFKNQPNFRTRQAWGTLGSSSAKAKRAVQVSADACHGDLLGVLSSAVSNSRM